MFEWTDPDTGEVFEINYVVAQMEDERDHYEYRNKTWPEGRWSELPPFVNGDDMKEIDTHFHGAVIEHIDPDEPILLSEGQEFSSFRDIYARIRIGSVFACLNGEDGDIYRYDPSMEAEGCDIWIVRTPKRWRFVR